MGGEQAEVDKKDENQKLHEIRSLKRLKLLCEVCSRMGINLKVLAPEKVLNKRTPSEKGPSDESRDFLINT